MSEKLEDGARARGVPAPSGSGSRSSLLILGLGNVLRGDDGVGAAVISSLQTLSLPDGVDLLDGGTAGLEIVLLLRQYNHVIVVDAAEMGLAAGEWRPFTSDDLLPASPSGLNGTLHNAGFAEALALAAALGELPAQLIIFGVQPQRVGWGEGLSTAVGEAVPALCQAILMQAYS